MEKTYNDAILVESGLKTAKNGQIRHIFGGAYSVVFPFFNGSAESAHGGDREPLGFKMHNKENYSTAYTLHSPEVAVYAARSQEHQTIGNEALARGNNA